MDKKESCNYGQLFIDIAKKVKAQQMQDLINSKLDVYTNPNNQQGENEMNEKFKNYTTSTAFSLSLSRNMIDNLCIVHARKGAFINRHAFQALHNRGLVEVDKTANLDLPNHYRDMYPCAKLTIAGEALMPLLVLSELYRVSEKLGINIEEQFINGENS
jgi:hypothetical protein